MRGMMIPPSLVPSMRGSMDNRRSREEVVTGDLTAELTAMQIKIACVSFCSRSLPTGRTSSLELSCDERRPRGANSAITRCVVVGTAVTSTLHR